MIEWKMEDVRWKMCMENVKCKFYKHLTFNMHIFHFPFTIFHA